MNTKTTFLILCLGIITWRARSVVWRRLIHWRPPQTRVYELIKGREQVTVDSVFQNLKVLGSFPAENLVFAMEKWSEALGVSCDHCHVTGEWASDVKKEKHIARRGDDARCAK
ncbi:MAG: hypothetical protein IPJ82_04560 [Lewinellaceae bacterium]|nr:hypothetical protein [Lewinellaceae bacterium]